MRESERVSLVILCLPLSLIGALISKRSDLFNALSITDVQHVVAANERFANVALALAVDPLLRVEELQVHVAVEGDECALVLHAPLELDNDRLVNQVDQERLRVDRNRLSIHLLWLRWNTAWRCCRHF